MAKDQEKHDKHSGNPNKDDPTHNHPEHQRGAHGRPDDSPGDPSDQDAKRRLGQYGQEGEHARDTGKGKRGT